MSHGHSSRAHAASKLSPVYYCAACAYNVFVPSSFDVRHFFSFLFFHSAPCSVHCSSLSVFRRTLSLPWHVSLPSFIFFSVFCVCSLSNCVTWSTSQAKWRWPRVYRETHYTSVYFYQRKCVVVRARIPAQPAPGKATLKKEGAWNAPRVQCTCVYFLFPPLSSAHASPSMHPLRSFRSFFVLLRKILDIWND